VRDYIVFKWLSEISTGQDHLFNDQTAQCKFKTEGLEFADDNLDFLYTKILIGLGVPNPEKKLVDMLAKYLEYIPGSKGTQIDLFNALSELLQVHIQVNELNIKHIDSPFVLKIFHNKNKKTYKICEPTAGGANGSARRQSGGRIKNRNSKKARKSKNARKSKKARK
jgi:hypothetical protein